MIARLLNALLNLLVFASLAGLAALLFLLAVTEPVGS